MSQIKLVRSGDWEGVYINNHLFSEGHSLDGETYLALIRAHRYRFDGTYGIYYTVGDWLEEIGNLPKKFEDIPINGLELTESET